MQYNSNKNIKIIFIMHQSFRYLSHLNFTQDIYIFISIWKSFTCHLLSELQYTKEEMIRRYMFIWMYITWTHLYHRDSLWSTCRIFDHNGGAVARKANSTYISTRFEFSAKNKYTFPYVYALTFAIHLVNYNDNK